MTYNLHPSNTLYSKHAIWGGLIWRHKMGMENNCSGHSPLRFMEDNRLRQTNFFIATFAMTWSILFYFISFSPLFLFIIIAVWLFIAEKLTYISVNIKDISHFYFPLKCMPFFEGPVLLINITYTFNRIIWMCHTRLPFI